MRDRSVSPNNLIDESLYRAGKRMTLIDFIIVQRCTILFARGVTCFTPRFHVAAVSSATGTTLEP